MNRYAGFLRAVNVGGTGKLLMTDLVAMCVDAGFSNIKTYIASGNVVFSTNMSGADAKVALEDKLEQYAGKKVPVFVRSAQELASVFEANPFAEKPAKFTVAIFLDVAPPVDFINEATGVNGEEIAPGRREIYVHYGNGMGRSKLKIPAAQHGTARNMNTIAKMVKMALDA
ncbi:MAG: DUF1697 domain-containing protein [Cohaesibacteraceae bacterium]|nr:DUF1697 domain-containing protein [Cohaesibacteraceae bacterium]